MAFGRTNARSGGFNKSVIIVTAPTGSTVTCTNGTTVKTATEKNGEWWFKNLDIGEWTLKATLSGQTATQIVNITRLGVYRISMSFHTIMEFTYTGDCETVQDDDTPIDDFSQWNGNWKIRFLTSGVFTVTNFHNFDGTIDVFLVGGGASGGGRGGGGGGYTKTQKSVSVKVGTEYPIIVGAGGVGPTTQNKVPPIAGGATSAFGLTANGGDAGSSSGNYPSTGGSGGGDGRVGGAGYPGGSDGSYGGGEQGAPGQGTTTREFEEANGTLYAGGGGGAAVTTNEASSGGDGGGGDGGGNNANPRPKNGGTNTGGGGGGIGQLYSAATYASGGSGIVIIRNAREVA